LPFIGLYRLGAIHRPAIVVVVGLTRSSSQVGMNKKQRKVVAGFLQVALIEVLGRQHFHILHGGILGWLTRKSRASYAAVRAGASALSRPNHPGRRGTSLKGPSLI
jgi:hypothetical protein